MDSNPPQTSDSNSGEFVDAECEFYQDAEEQQQKHSNINEIRVELSVKNAVTEKPEHKNIEKEEEVEGVQLKEANSSLKQISDTITTAASTSSLASEASSSNITNNTTTTLDNDYDYMQDDIWKGHRKHIFVLSEAGKPIYSLHGKEDKLATLFGIIQALVSFVQQGEDTITSIDAHGIKFVFLLRNPMILVAASRTNMSVQQLQMQLSDVYNQILSILTYSHMQKIFEKRKNFDLRRLLAGSERLINNLLSNDSSNKHISNNVFTFLTNSIRVMALPTAVRSNIVSTIQSNCSKIKNLVFAILIADNKLITLVRMKKYSIHPADLRLIFNMIECSESFKASENWTPICLPKFDMNGYLHAHVSYLADDCQACLILLSVDRDAFFTLSDAKKRITEKLRRTHCLEAINDEMKDGLNSKINYNSLGVYELRHFLYKPKGVAQILCSEIMPPYVTLKEFERLEGIYCSLLDRIHHKYRPLKLIYEVKEREVTLAWVTAAYEFCSVFEPLVDRADVIKYVDKLIKHIEKEQDIFFIRNHPTF